MAKIGHGVFCWKIVDKGLSSTKYFSSFRKLSIYKEISSAVDPISVP
jgi:hypothetical protein